MVHERPRLLIVDDETFNSALLTRIFRDSCAIDIVENGHDALARLETNDYDVVLLDIMMPELSGLDVLGIIRNSQNISEMPVILISAMNEKRDVAQGIRLGANDYITKPLDVDIVIARVNSQIKLKQLRDERSRMIAQLQAANEMKARMMQVASHDLKNPLNNLQMLTQLMRKQAEDKPKLLKMMNMQEDSLNAMLHVITDFLDSSIASSHEIRLELRPLDCVTLVRQVLNQYSVAAHNKQIMLNPDSIEGIIMADDRRFMQVFGNLVSNAIKYSPKGSSVQVYSETYEEAQRWRLVVHDSGLGIPEAEQEFLFKPFSKHQISTNPTDGEASTGLGLWIVYEMMRLQEGSVGMYNHSEGGACFWLELPLAPKGAKV